MSSESPGLRVVTDRSSTTHPATPGQPWMVSSTTSHHICDSTLEVRRNCCELQGEMARNCSVSAAESRSCRRCLSLTYPSAHAFLGQLPIHAERVRYRPFGQGLAPCHGTCSIHPCRRPPLSLSLYRVCTFTISIEGHTIFILYNTIMYTYQRYILDITRPPAALFLGSGDTGETDGPSNVLPRSFRHLHLSWRGMASTPSPMRTLH